MKSDRTYLLHIRDAIERIEQYASHGHDAFLLEPEAVIGTRICADVG